MKFSSQEEFGLRCLIQVARHQHTGGVTIQYISEAEKLTVPNVAKLLRILRMGGFIESTRGQIGGYTLARSADKILIGNVLEVLGGRLFETGFCDDHSGVEKICTHTTDCSVRSLWRKIQNAVDQALLNMTLEDLLSQETINPFMSEEEMKSIRA
jgi:Rrf2 family protein